MTQRKKIAEKRDCCGTRRYGYGRVIFFARFAYFLLQTGLMESFGVLLPGLRDYYEVSNATIGFITSLSITTMYLGVPVVKVVLSQVKHPRFVTSLCGLVAGVAFISTAFVKNVYIFATLFLIMGLSSAFLNLRTFELLYEYFPDDFAFISGISVISMPIGEALAPALTERILTAYGLHWAVLINGALFLNMFPIGISLKTKSPSKGYEEPTTKSAEEESLLPRSGDHNGFVRNGSLRRGRSSSHGQSNHRSRSSSAEENAGYSLSSALTAVSKFTHLDVLAKEPIFTAFLLPSVSLTYLTICGWTFFVVVYALSEGIEISRGAFLLPAGALGGFLSSCIFCCILCWRESWCPYLYLGSLLLAAFGFFIQVLNSSYIYLLVTSFIIGFGLCGGNVTSEAMIAWLVEPENVPDACNPFLFVIGLAYLFSGYMTGFVQDRTHSTKKVFILLGSVLLAASLLGGVAVVIGRKKRTARQNQMRVS